MPAPASPEALMPRVHQQPIRVIDPVEFVKMNWPDVYLYQQQREIMYSVRDNDETVVPAGNGLGKDFISALICLWFFCSRRPAKVVTTSVKSDQLNDVLWGEMRKFIETSKNTLPIQYNHLKIRQKKKDGELVGNAELVGQVINQGEALLGRHLPRFPGWLPATLCVFDECSGIDDSVFDSSDTWAHRKLLIGNCFPCTNNFYKGVKSGDIPAPDGKRFYRKVIRIKAIDSPNVQLGLAQEAAGIEPTNEILIPGVVDYATYKKRRFLWDPVMQCIGLDADFFEGGSVRLFPPEWLNHAESIAARHKLQKVVRRARAMGVDPAEGGDKTCWTVIDEYGIIEMVSRLTPNTTDVVKITLALMKQYQIPAESVLFDRGGGGKEHVDSLREAGYKVRSIGFGEPATDQKKYNYGSKSKDHRIDVDETRYAYKNRRAEMYGEARRLIDPSKNKEFGIGVEYVELRKQLAPIPLDFDGEGRLVLPPKHKKPGSSDKTVTLVDMIGHSPDEADSFVLAVFAMTNNQTKKSLKAF